MPMRPVRAAVGGHVANHAITRARAEALEALLDAGADVELRNMAGESAMAIATRKRASHVQELLSKHVAKRVQSSSSSRLEGLLTLSKRNK
jgi:ankyrin repeat protein